MLNHDQMCWRGSEGVGARDGASEPLFQALWRCPAAFLARCASSSPAAAASFPGTEPSLFLCLLYPDLDRTERKTGVSLGNSHKHSTLSQVNNTIRLLYLPVRLLSCCTPISFQTAKDTELKSHSVKNTSGAKIIYRWPHICHADKRTQTNGIGWHRADL